MDSFAFYSKTQNENVKEKEALQNSTKSEARVDLLKAENNKRLISSYCEKTGNEFGMYGVLIYTASGDSEGSFGGLVRQGEKGRLEDTIISAIENAIWCTSDPICIQSTGQGPESLNLAACHNCALLPETCCENGNRLLD